MPLGEPTLYEEAGAWVVRLEGSEGRFQLYQCATREQAERLCALFRQPIKSARPASAEAPGATGSAKPKGWSWFATRSLPPASRG
jgi:hypothetical protein